MLPAISVRGLMFKFNSFVAKLRTSFFRNYLIRRKANKDIYQGIYSRLTYLNCGKIVRGKYEKHTLTFQCQNLTQGIKRFQGVGNNFKNQKLENYFQNFSAKRIEVLDA